MPDAAPGAVLVTRPEPGASETAARLRRAGLVAVVAPFLTVRTCAAELPGGLQAVLVTSGNALAALPARLHRLPLLAVGDRTAERARAIGFSSAHSAEGDAAALARAAVARFDPAGGALLLASGRGQGEALAGSLRDAGFAVHHRSVYAAEGVAAFPEPAARALGTGVRAALFFSAETARVFVRLLPPGLAPALAGAEALAIGAAAAAALRGLPFRAVRVSVRPTSDGVLALL